MFFSYVCTNSVCTTVFCIFTKYILGSSYDFFMYNVLNIKFPSYCLPSTLSTWNKSVVFQNAHILYEPNKSTSWNINIFAIFCSMSENLSSLIKVIVYILLIISFSGMEHLACGNTKDRMMTRMIRKRNQNPRSRLPAVALFVSYTEIS